MTNQEYSEPDRTTSSDAIQGGPGLLRQLGNGLGGLAVLLLTGLILMIVVVLKSR
ncbi:hypothetical protein [Devosia beringensis]|uniref:hypothetical protein n=1 Tax=Devosia beringensis TaxID=2657486 RepID=UPI00186B92D6|nr:hypothetical protein [Devosia beringensis]